MAVNVGINGFGRIGRNVLRALHAGNHTDELRVVAINDLGDARTLAHLTQYDTVHGRFPGTVTADDGMLRIDGHEISMLAQRDPAQLPWAELGVELVIESTGLFTSREQATAHLQAGAGKVLISAPAGDDVPTIVHGVNEQMLTAEDRIVSNASCTTNCIAPLLQVLQRQFGVDHGYMNTVHAYTNGQVLIDGYHADLRRARDARRNIYPTTTGAIRAVEHVLPELAGRMERFAVRVATDKVSCVDLTVQGGRDTDTDQINRLFEQAAAHELAGILDYTEAELVSSDYNHNPASATVDAMLTRVLGGRLVKLCAWYDNEWGFSSRMLDTALTMLRTA